jgi:FkbM family methyltransferase
LRRVLRSLGVEVIAYAPRNFPHLRRAGLLQAEAIDVVLDVGASDGAWAKRLRDEGYLGRIVCFEPLDEPVLTISGCEWRRLALGNRSGRAVFHVAANRQSSSLLGMTSLHLRHAPESREERTIEVDLAPLDELGVISGGERAYLKLDVQGAELDVLRGAEETLRRVRAAEVELSAVTLYEGQALIGEVIEHLRNAGLGLIGIEPSFRDRQTGDLLQANGFFRRAAA